MILPITPFESNF